MESSNASAPSELDAIVLQMAVTLGVALLCSWLYARYRKPVFGAWAATWGLYVMRLVAILAFIATGAQYEGLLYWHQVVTGWTGIGVLATSLIFSRRLRWRPVYLLALLFPPAWSYVAIYRLDQFLLAALPAVLFLSGATLWTGRVFLHYARRTRSPGARVLAFAFIAWGLHHLDYPFLRAYGGWAPWGYYLDIIFTLTVATGILLLVADELRSGVVALATLADDRAAVPEARRDGLLDGLLSRAVAVPAVAGAALYVEDAGGIVCQRGAGICREWTGSRPHPADSEVIHRATKGDRRAVLARGWTPPNHGAATAKQVRFAAVLPLENSNDSGTSALVIVSEDHDPFAALDADFLTALGRQVGSTLALADLNRQLAERGGDLERLSSRIVVQQEEERKRLSRDLHDEAAQLLSAVKIELMAVRGSLPESQADRIDDALALTDAGIRSIRAVIEGLRPSLLDDLGLVPAVRSLLTAFAERSGCKAHMTTPDDGILPALSSDAELAFFRVVQEGLSNVARHASATRVWVTFETTGDRVALAVEDDGRGIAPSASDYPALGIIGMRERLAALKGTLELTERSGGGAILRAELPVTRGEAGPSE